MVRPAALTALWLVACGFSSQQASSGDDAPTFDAAVDPPVITCGDLHCDANATCSATGPAACTCKSGFTGNGMTCTDVDECARDNGGCAAACMNTPGSFVCYAPPTCADVKAHVPGAGDGPYTLYLGSDAMKPWKGFCAGMAQTPLEYLSLTGNNSSQYTSGGSSPGGDVKTTYTKVRFDPAAMKIDIADRTYASSTGMLTHSNMTPVTSMPYGVAMDCRGMGSKAGVASIDLAATAFALTGPAAFAAGGNLPGSDVRLSAANQKATINGGGFCGWNAPSGVPMNPFNNNVTSGLLLPVVYAP